MEKMSQIEHAKNFFVENLKRISDFPDLLVEGLSLLGVSAQKRLSSEKVIANFIIAPNEDGQLCFNPKNAHFVDFLQDSLIKRDSEDLCLKCLSRKQTVYFPYLIEALFQNFFYGFSKNELSSEFKFVIEPEKFKNLEEEDKKFLEHLRIRAEHRKKKKNILLDYRNVVIPALEISNIEYISISIEVEQMQEELALLKSKIKEKKALLVSKKIDIFKDNKEKYCDFENLKLEFDYEETFINKKFISYNEPLRFQVLREDLTPL
jgi:hypothetical protein